MQDIAYIHIHNAYSHVHVTVWPPFSVPYVNKLCLKLTLGHHGEKLKSSSEWQTAFLGKNERQIDGVPRKVYLSVLTCIF